MFGKFKSGRKWINEKCTSISGNWSLNNGGLFTIDLFEIKNHIIEKQAMIKATLAMILFRQA